MKKIFFAACMAGILAASLSATAQTYWTGSTTATTTTTGNCNVAGSVNVGTNNNVVGNIGLGLANPTDSRLHIENNVYDNAFSSTSIPEFKIQRNTWALTLTSNPPNIFEIWKTDYANTHLPSTFHGPNLLDVITNDGKMGILYSTPVHSLDVGGNVGINEGDLYMLKPSNDGWRNIFAQSSAGGLALYTNSATYDGPAIMMTGNSASTYPGDMRFFDGTGRDSRFVFGKPAGGSANGSMVEQFVIDGNGDLSMPRDNDNTWRSFKAMADHATFQINSNTGSDNGSSIELTGKNSDNKGRIGFICNDDNDDHDGIGFDFLKYIGSSTWKSNMRIYKNGKVVIGAETITMPSDYKLYVEKGILTEKLKVALSSDPTNWSDFVFNDDYKLKSLGEVESYINTNKHLPDVPSAKEVFKDGIDVAKMDAKLLQKIEELTLYSIQQQKLIEQMQKEMANMKKELSK